MAFEKATGGGVERIDEREKAEARRRISRAIAAIQSPDPPAEFRDYRFGPLPGQKEYLWSALGALAPLNDVWNRDVPPEDEDALAALAERPDEEKITLYHEFWIAEAIVQNDGGIQTVLRTRFPLVRVSREGHMTHSAALNLLRAMNLPASMAVDILQKALARSHRGE